MKGFTGKTGSRDSVNALIRDWKDRAYREGVTAWTAKKQYVHKKMLKIKGR